VCFFAERGKKAHILIILNVPDILAVNKTLSFFKVGSRDLGNSLLIYNHSAMNPLTFFWFRQQPHHYRGYRHTVRSEKQIKMVWNQRPGVTRCGSTCHKMNELITESFSIDIILKNISALNSPAYDMMQAFKGVYAGLAG
jgi:hypothetical protein